MEKEDILNTIEQEPDINISSEQAQAVASSLESLLKFSGGDAGKTTAGLLKAIKEAQLKGE